MNISKMHNKIPNKARPDKTKTLNSELSIVTRHTRISIEIRLFKYLKILII